jgi:stage V sporulation protein G
MNITEVNIKLVQSPNSRLRAFCTLTLNNEIVIRDVKIIDGAKGPFVAMPSRKLMDRCPRCSSKNHLRARSCNNCGSELRPDRATVDEEGRPRLHVDVCHPINSTARASLQEKVLASFNEELEKSKSPDYKPAAFPSDMDYDMYSEDDEHGTHPSPRQAPPPPPAAPKPEEPTNFGDGIV